MTGRLFLVSLVVALVGCGGGPTGPDDVAGTYTLQSVDGGPLPWRIGDTASKILDLTAGTAVLGLDLSCSVSLTIQTREFDVFGELGDPTTMTETDPCTYILSNAGLTLNYADGEPDTGFATGSQITISRHENVLLFRQ
jgi:hypothetical protein